MPDLFHRLGAYTPPDPRALFADPAVRAAWWKQAGAATSPATALRDVTACLAYLAATPDARPGPIAATGYCMGGRFALVAGGTFPDRFAAIAAYHPGQLVTDAPDSPHLVAAKARAPVYVAAATDDATLTEEHQAALAASLIASGVRHLIETYPARRGFVLADTPVHDAAATARHWETLLALLADELPVFRIGNRQGGDVPRSQRAAHLPSLARAARAAFSSAADRLASCSWRRCRSLRAASASICARAAPRPARA
jgi:carboxymethylenebutenolidase